MVPTAEIFWSGSTSALILLHFEKITFFYFYLLVIFFFSTLASWRIIEASFHYDILIVLCNRLY